MDKDGFWNLIDEVNRETGGRDRDSVLKATQKKLVECSLRDIVDFHNLLSHYMDLADTPNLVAAAATINDGVSDDGFTDFRAWLISQGKAVYTNALKCADSLAEVEIDPEPYSTQFEFYGYIGSDAYNVKSLLERKGIEGIVDNEYFSMKPKGVELVKDILENHGTYENPHADSEDPVEESLYLAVKGQLRSGDVYDEAKKRPLSERQKEDIRSELEFEPPIEWKRRWTPGDLREAVPELYGKYMEHEYTIGGM